MAAAHAAIHGVLCLILLAPRPAAEALLIAAGLAVIHATIDWLKIQSHRDGPIAFCADQVAHIITLVVAAAMASTAPFQAVEVTRHLLATRRLYLYAAGYIALVPAAGHLVQRVTKHFAADLGDDLLAKKPGLPDAGKYIGWLERFLIVTFLLARHGEVIAFLVGAKAVIRYPELKENEKGHFADYFLIGTMTSVGIALVGGLALMQIASRLH